MTKTAVPGLIQEPFTQILSSKLTTSSKESASNSLILNKYQLIDIT